MEDLRSHSDDEIDLMELIQTIWNGKLRIASIIAACVFGVLGVYFIQPPPMFVATTEIKPITSVEAELYNESNAVGFFEISPQMLLDLYIEQFEGMILQVVQEFGLLKKDTFEDEQSYNEAVIELASSLQILPPSNADGNESDEIRRFWTIVFENNDYMSWIDALSSVNRSANEEVRQTIIRRFESNLSVSKLKDQFELEDLATQIANLKIDYNRKTSDRLAYLGEQAAIARKLGVANNTIEAQTFSTKSGMVATVKTDTPFYLRGYDAIEKEIELIESRKEKEAFVIGLLELEQKRRAIEQDKTLERAEQLFASTPVITPDTFSAVSVTVEATYFEYQNKLMLKLVLAVIIGLMIGVFYVIISDAMRKRSQPYV